MNREQLIRIATRVASTAAVLATAVSMVIRASRWRPAKRHRAVRQGAHKSVIREMGKVTIFPFTPVRKFKGLLYRSCMPSGTYDTECEVLPQWKALGITHVVCLVTPRELVYKSGRDLLTEYGELGYTVAMCPLQRYSETEIRQIVPTVDTLNNWLRDGRRVVIHCSAGVGRTSMFLACFLQATSSMDAEAAVQFVRGRIQGCLRSSKRLAIVKSFLAAYGDARKN